MTTEDTIDERSGLGHLFISLHRIDNSDPSGLTTPFLPHAFRQTPISAIFPPKANS